VAAFGNGTALASKTSPAPAEANSVLCVPIGRSLLRTLVAASEREGIDLATLTAGLIWLGLGRQEAYLYSRQQRAAPDDAPNTTVAVVCLACGRGRTDPYQTRCATCGGSWTTAHR
jgi:hypothetical protein